ncbi:hypothetical protein C8Q76DRAFT_752716 [Earliella scabrosa]|nr:hypothetical protein C8Q76DRAFT_752716 [Earliella scabrosa]
MDVSSSSSSAITTASSLAVLDTRAESEVDCVAGRGAAESPNPCQCWNHLAPRPLHDIRTQMDQMCAEHALNAAKAETKQAITALNDLVTVILQWQEAGADASHTIDPVHELGHAVSSRLAAAAVYILRTPGPQCLHAIEIDGEDFAERYRTLRQLEDELTATMRRLNQDIDAHVRKRDRSRRGIWLVRNAIRAGSILSIPYSPLCSAVLTAFDTFAMSVIVIVHKASSTRAEEESVDKLDELQKKCQDMLDRINRLRMSLESVRERGKDTPQDPAVLRRAEVLKKLLLAHHRADSPSVLDCCSGTPAAADFAPLLGLIASMREVADSFVDDRSFVEETLFSVSVARLELLHARATVE